MYKYYLKKAQQGQSTKQGQSTSQKKYNVNDYIDTLIENGYMKDTPENRRAVETFAYIGTQGYDSDETKKLINKYYGGDYRKFRQEFDATGLINPKKLGTANDPKKGWGSMTSEMAKKFVEGFSEETEDKYDCIGGYCNGPFVVIKDKKTKKLVRPDIPLTDGLFTGKVKLKLQPNDYRVREWGYSVRDPKSLENYVNDYLDKTYYTKRLKYKPSYQAGGMLKGMPHEAGGQVLVDEQGNPMAEAEGGEIIFSLGFDDIRDGKKICRRIFRRNRRYV